MVINVGRVKVLSKETSELIAAGEVIERPSSVIKELIENAVDSGADSITVEIKSGGISYIRVTDNGCGMVADDVPVAFLRHATSKIQSGNDLNRLSTLGFRGEALASICAVAKVEVLTKTKDEMFGTHYVIEGSEQKCLEQSGCPDGTTIVIRDIFYNVPARLKFLKSDTSEGNKIADITSKIAMSHPEISFKFIRNNKRDFFTPGDGELYSSVYSVMGKDFADSMIPVHYELNGVRIDGLTVKPVYGRNKRIFQYFFVNGRYVKSYVCTNALDEAYANCMMEGKFPACVLRINMSADMLDVNVHPAKIEVRFTDERMITESIYFAVKNAILADSKPVEIQINRPVPDYTRPLTAKAPEPATQMMFAQTPVSEIPYKPVADDVHKCAVVSQPVAAMPENENQSRSAGIVEAFSKTDDDSLQTAVPYEISSSSEEKDIVPIEKITPADIAPQEFKYISPAPTAEKTSVVVEKPEKEVFFRIIGEAFKDYIISEIGDKIVFVDKHAAHERILFEKLRSGKQQLQCQLMLDPIRVILPYDDYEALSANIEEAGRLGFDITPVKERVVNVNGVPDILDGCDPTDLVTELAHNFAINRNNPMPEILDDMFHTFACKAAIKANDITDLKELSYIVRTLLENESIRYCPHGRPVMFSLTKYELEKQFKRIV